jgi:hypothetical protein
MWMTLLTLTIAVGLLTVLAAYYQIIEDSDQGEQS